MDEFTAGRDPMDIQEIDECKHELGVMQSIIDTFVLKINAMQDVIDAQESEIGVMQSLIDELHTDVTVAISRSDFWKSECNLVRNDLGRTQNDLACLTITLTNTENERDRLMDIVDSQADRLIDCAEQLGNSADERERLWAEIAIQTDTINARDETISAYRVMANDYASKLSDERISHNALGNAYDALIHEYQSVTIERDSAKQDLLDCRRNYSNLQNDLAENGKRFEAIDRIINGESE